MDSDTLYTQKNDPEYEYPSSQDVFLKSRNLFRHKDEQRLLTLSCVNWLHIVKSSPKVSCEVSTSPSHSFSKAEENCKVISLPSKTFLSPSIGYSQGTLQFTIRANQTPQFVFKLENQKEIYVASSSSTSVLDIHLQNGESTSRLVGRIKVSDTLSSDSSLNKRIIERKFVLFSSNDGDHQQKLPCKNKNRGLSRKVVDVIKNNQCTSGLRCSWDQQLQEPNFENNLPTNLESLAVVVRREFPEEYIGGWGLKFLKQSTRTSRDLISMDVVIPSGIHGGPEDGPQSLIERWKSQGKCDCGGWDLGCYLTLLKGQQRKDQFELFIEGSKHETSALRIVYVHGGLYLVQFQTELSILQSFLIALAFIHSKQLRPLSI